MTITETTPHSKMTLLPRRNLQLCPFIIPVLIAVCMFVSGCDATDDQSLQSRSSLTTEKQTDRRSRTTSPANPEAAESTCRSAGGQRLRIVALGNSLTAGLGVPPEESYPSQLQRRLDQAGYPVRVINAGVSGDTTAGALRRLPWVLKSQPSIVIIELGANDGLRGQPVNNTHKNLRLIIQRLQSAGVKVVLTDMKMPPNYGVDYTAKFAEMYVQLADEFNVPFMPFFLDGVAANRALNQADGIHPTGEGYKIIVDKLVTVLEPILKSHARTFTSS